MLQTPATPTNHLNKLLNMDAETKRELTRINDKLNKIVAGQQKSTWVSPLFITDLTGWDKEKLRQARQQNIVECKRDGRGWLYKLESVPEQFIIKKQAS
jgi:hypothetical protein